MVDSSTSTGDEVSDILISRGMHEECKIKWDKVQHYVVYDELGNKIRFGDIYGKQKNIIIFVRNFLCYVCKEYVEDLARIPLEYLQEADVRLVVIGPAPAKFIKDFRRVTGLQYSLYVDPERELYKELGCKEKAIKPPLVASKHVKSSVVMGIMKSTWRAMKSPREYQGDINQQGAAFLIGPGDTLHYSHLDQSPTDHAPINDILAEAGVRQVSFENDPRVQHL